MRKLLLLPLVFPFGCFACEIPMGTYEAITESEYSLSLELLDNGRYRFVHKNWLPGELHHVGEEHIYKGEYRCEGNKVILEYTDIGEAIVGYYRNRSLKDDDFPIDKKSYVLDFSSDENTKSKITGWVYWPKDFIMNSLD